MKDRFAQQGDEGSGFTDCSPIRCEVSRNRNVSKHMGCDTSIVVLNLVRMTPAHRAFSRAGYTGIERSRNYADHRRRSVSV